MHPNDPLQHWRIATRGLEMEVDVAVLSAIAQRGYRDMGRGAVVINTSRTQGQLMAYLNAAALQRGLSRERWQRVGPTVEQYDPHKQLVVVVRPIDDEAIKVDSFLMRLQDIPNTPEALKRVSDVLSAKPNYIWFPEEKGEP